MKKIILLFLFPVLLHSCQTQTKDADKKSGFEKSYKEQKVDGTLSEYTENLDTLNNIYSNFKYRVGFNGPDGWTIDSGMNEHTIYRTYQIDSAITFSLNVIEVKFDQSELIPNIWEFYQENKEKMDYPYTQLIPKQFNSEVKDFRASKAFIKNQPALKRTFSYLIRDLDYEYSNTSIIYQTFLDKHTYTFSLDVPTMYYEEKPYYYENIFSNITFFFDKDELKKVMNNKK